MSHLVSHTSALPLVLNSRARNRYLAQSSCSGMLLPFGTPMQVTGLLCAMRLVFSSFQMGVLWQTPLTLLPGVLLERGEQ